MPRKTIKVEIPINSPSKMELLVETIIAKNTELGVDSPVKDLVTVDFTNRATLESTKRNSAHSKHMTAESLTEEANVLMGIAFEQNINTPGTLYFYIGKFRDQLLNAYQNHEEKLSTFGFNLTKDKVNGRKTIKVEIPINQMLKMEKLCADIIARHTELGVDSPLAQADIDVFTPLLASEIAKRKEASKYHSEAQDEMEEAVEALGTGREQNVKTTGTIYNIVVRVKNKLLDVYQNNEENLSVWGFDVVIGQAHMPGYHSEQKETVIINAGVTYFMPVDNLTGKTIIQIQNTGEADITAVLVPTKEDDPSGILPVIHAGETNEYLLRNHELKEFTVAHFLRLRNTSEDKDTTVTITIWR